MSIEMEKNTESTNLFEKIEKIIEIIEKVKQIIVEGRQYELDEHASNAIRMINENYTSIHNEMKKRRKGRSF